MTGHLPASPFVGTKIQANLPMRDTFCSPRDEHIESDLVAIAISVLRNCGRIAHLGDESCHSPALSSGMSCTFDMRFQQLLVEPS
jgi:hypothetical protein